MTNKHIIAIDPGTEKSGYAVIETDTYKPLDFGKVTNEEIIQIIDDYCTQCNLIVFERFTAQSHIGMTTVDAITWYGRFIEHAYIKGYECYPIYRRDVKKHLLGKFSKENGSADSQIRKALVARFARFDKVNGKGKKDNPDWFYGFATTDAYAAYAVGVTYLDIINGDKNERN